MKKTLEPIIQALAEFPKDGTRRLLALAGPPGAGKSTVSDALCSELKTRGFKAEVVPMDGFHLDNRLLAARGLSNRKGSPETFDAAGFLNLVKRLSEQEDVIAPVFDRTRDISIAGAVELSTDVDWLIVEGNYLLLNRPVWRALKTYWSLSVMLDVPLEEIERRLVQRWLDEGFDREQALAKVRGNDLPNAETILAESSGENFRLSNVS